MLLVLVYLSMTATLAGRLQAEAHEQALHAGQPVPSEFGPQLVAGYGPSTWRGNVALVQTTQFDLQRMGRFESDRKHAGPMDSDAMALTTSVATL